MSEIFVASRKPKKGRKAWCFEKTGLSAFFRELQNRSNRGDRQFLVAATLDPKPAEKVASMIAAFKMKQLDADFHFCGKK